MDRIDVRGKAVQAAMAAEIGARLGRMNRSKAWLHREAGISASAWRQYFTAFHRDARLSALQSIAEVLGMRTGELITLAEDHAHEYADQFMGHLTADERRAWRELMHNGGRRDAEGGESQEDLTGS
jgi:hypothetical protein